MSTISVNPLEEKVDVLKHKNVTVPKGTKTQDYALKFVAAALSSEFISAFFLKPSRYHSSVTL